MSSLCATFEINYLILHLTEERVLVTMTAYQKKLSYGSCTTANSAGLFRYLTLLYFLSHITCSSY